MVKKFNDRLETEKQRIIGVLREDGSTRTDLEEYNYNQDCARRNVAEEMLDDLASKLEEIEKKQEFIMENSIAQIFTNNVTGGRSAKSVSELYKEKDDH